MGNSVDKGSRVGHFKPNLLCNFCDNHKSAQWKADAMVLPKHPLQLRIYSKIRVQWPFKPKPKFWWEILKGWFGDNCRVKVKILKPKYLSFPWSKLKNHSDHQVEKFLNYYMRITDELNLLNSSFNFHTKMKEKVKLKV